MYLGIKDSCGDLVTKLNSLPLQSQYIFSLLMFVVKNKDLFKTNSYVHSFNTRSRHVLHIPAANLAVLQNGVCYSGIKINNHLPPIIKKLSYDSCLMVGGRWLLILALRRFFYTKSFYSL